MKYHAAALVLTVLVASCGQAGPLVLPDAAPAAPAAPPAPAEPATGADQKNGE
jgi:predicted small lipoprotein YifL